MHYTSLLPSTLFLAAVSLPLCAAPTDVPGVNNFHKVDEHVYRGAQPSDRGFQNLAKLGIKTVVDLQEPGSRGREEAKAVAAAGMQYVSVPMRGMETPSTLSVSKVLTLLEDTTTGPVFVHCHRGADRTGAVIACYRVEHDHWQNDQALSEARTYGMSWFQLAIQSYVRGYSPKPATPASQSAGSQTVAAADAPQAAIPALAFSPAN